MNDNKLHIIVAGYIVRGPLGGLVWHHLQYVLALKQMGHEVLFIEESDDYASCYHPLTHQLGFDPAYGLNFIDQVFSYHDIKNSWAFYHKTSGTWYGKSEKKIRQFIARADVYINLSGSNNTSDQFLRIPVRIFIDTDPVFTQVKHLTDKNARLNAAKHNAFFTYGENFGKANCSIPNDGFPWRATRQPVYHEVWPNSIGNKSGNWTTVMQWESYKESKFNNEMYGMKSASFEHYSELPKKTDEKFELAVGNVSAPREQLTEQGWYIRNPLQVSMQPHHYQAYIQQSKGEWSVAKHGYVVSNSGWFSERSAGYLASGRPVITQETGYSANIPTGNGLFSFTTNEEILDALHAVNSNYDAHCKYAKEIAREYFSFEKIFADLLTIHQPSITA